MCIYIYIFIYMYYTDKNYNKNLKNKYFCLNKKVERPSSVPKSAIYIYALLTFEPYGMNKRDDLYSSRTKF